MKRRTEPQNLRFSEVDTESPPLPLPLEPVDHVKPTVDAAVDICEDEFEYLFVVEVPGIAIDDIEVGASEGMLEVRGLAELKAVEQSKRYLKVERSLGECHRAFTLPPDAAVDDLHYGVLDGVLHVHVPKLNPPATSGTTVSELQDGKGQATSRS